MEVMSLGAVEVLSGVVLNDERSMKQLLATSRSSW